MKKVFPNDMVAHVWAQQKQDEGRSGNGNFSFSGPTIYSYGTPIANIVTGTRKRKGALLTSQSYSVTTTGKHKNATWSAWHGNGPSFTVPFLGVTGGRAFRHPDATNMKEVHKGNRSACVNMYGNQWRNGFARIPSAQSKRLGPVASGFQLSFERYTDDIILCEGRKRARQFGLVHAGRKSRRVFATVARLFPDRSIGVARTYLDYPE
jgi:hypothetical protein